MAAFGGARGAGARPPEKGIFPLDHFGECKKLADAYRACLQERDADADRCRDLAQQYLKCRMDRNLMARQDMDELGFRQDLAAVATQQQEGRAADPKPAPSSQPPPR